MTTPNSVISIVYNRHATRNQFRHDHSRNPGPNRCDSDERPSGDSGSLPGTGKGLQRGAWLVAVVALAACGGAVPASYRGDCLTFTSKDVLDESALAFDVDLARQKLVRLGIVTADDFCSRLDGTPITVYEADTFRCWGSICSGQTDIFTHEVKLGRSTKSLAHELAHILDYQVGDLGSIAHPDWATNGRLQALNTEYRAEHRNP